MKLKGLLFLSGVLAVSGCWLIPKPEPEPPRIQQTEELEITIRATDNEVTFHRTQAQIKKSVNECLVRGTYDLNRVPFVPELFNKYFLRLVQNEEGGKVDTVFATEMFRKQQKRLGHFRVWDKPKPGFYDLDQTLLRLEILDVKALTDSLRNDEYEEKLEIERWKWGTEERRKFIPLIIEDATPEFIRQLNIRDTLVIVGRDTVEKFKRFEIPGLIISDSLGMRGNINSIVARMAPRARAAFQNELARHGVPNSARGLDVLADERIDKRFMKAFRIKKKWLKKYMQ